tara:strand:+ start:2391 stop:2516 length:126 start_codon:yes stop_codon:yes gene_type:complete
MVAATIKVIINILFGVKFDSSRADLKAPHTGLALGYGDERL